MLVSNIQCVIAEFAKDVSEILGNDLKKIILYGSYARGDYTATSDVDIMILTSLSDAEIEHAERPVFDLAFDVLMETGVDISVVIKNEEHFNYWLGALPFYNNVQREGIVING